MTSLSRIIRPCYRIRLTDGREIVSSAEHLWLTGFRPTSDPRCEVCGRTWSSAKNAAIHKAKMHGIGTNWTDGRFSWVATQDLKPGTLIKDLGVPWDEDTSKGVGYLAASMTARAPCPSRAPAPLASRLTSRNFPAT